MTPQQPRRTKIFISYSHRDSPWLERLRVHLRPLERDFEADIWDDTKIESGAKWREEIERALGSSAVAILLVSADFLGSDFIAGNELPPLLRAAEDAGTVILPVILSHSGFRRHEVLSQFQAFNDPSKPMLNMSRGGQEAVFEKVAERVAELLGAPATLARSKPRTVRAKRSMRFARLRKRVAANVVHPPKESGEMNSNVLTEVDVPHDGRGTAKKWRRIGYLLTVTAVSLATLAVLIVMAVKHFGDHAVGVSLPKTSSYARSDISWPQLAPAHLQSDIVRVTLENGEAAKVFDERLNIHVDGIRYDEEANQYLVTFHFSSATTRELRFRDVTPSSEKIYLYPVDARFRIQLLSAEASFADFSIEETLN